MKYHRNDIKRLIDELFSKYKGPYINEYQYQAFFKAKGFTSEEVEKIIFEAERLGLIEMTADMVEEGKFVLCIYRPEEDEDSFISEDEILGKRRRRRRRSR